MSDSDQARAITSTMVTKKIRTEYMKKFRDPKWETFSKCYEDSLKYRLTRRVMEHSHKPWFWEGWDNSSDSSGWSTPRVTRNKVAPLSVPLQPPTASEVKQKMWELKSSPKPPPSEDGEAEVGSAEEPAADAAPNTEAVVENCVNETNNVSAAAALSTITVGPADETLTDNGPADTASSDGESVKPTQKRRHRRRIPRAELGHRDGSQDNKPAAVRKPPRAKSQPPSCCKEKENWRPSSQLDLSERLMEVRRATNDSHTADACVQTRRDSDKRMSNLDRRRARSADLDKLRRSQLTVADDRWMTEYMRCFSARLR